MVKSGSIWRNTSDVIKVTGILKRGIFSSILIDLRFSPLVYNEGFRRERTLTKW